MKYCNNNSFVYYNIKVEFFLQYSCKPPWDAMMMMYIHASVNRVSNNTKKDGWHNNINNSYTSLMFPIGIQGILITTITILLH